MSLILYELEVIVKVDILILNGIFIFLIFLYLCRGLKKDKRTCGSSSKKIASLNESKQEQASGIYKWGSAAGMASLFYPKSTRGKTAGQSSSCHFIVDFLPWFAS